MRNLPIAAFALLLTLPGAATASAATPAVAVHINVSGGKHSVTLIDRDSLAVIGTAEFDHMAMPLRFDATGKSLLVLTKKSLLKPSFTFWSVDTQSAEKTLVAEFGPGLGSKSNFLGPGPGSTRVFLIGRTKRSKQATISAFDSATLKPLGQLASVEDFDPLMFSPDGTLLYAFNHGSPRSLRVLDTTSWKDLGRIEVGKRAVSLAFDVPRGLAYVLGLTDLGGNGMLIVLRGGAQVARFVVSGRTVGLKAGPDGVSYVLTSNAVIALDADGLAPARTWKLSFEPSDLIFDPGHDLMFAKAASNSKIAKMRIAEAEVLAEHSMGDPGRKVGMGVAQALFFTAAIAGAAGGANVSAPSFPGQNSTSMLLGDDGATLYVLNPYTDDVSSFDVAKEDVVDIVHTGLGSSRFVQLPGDPTFWVQSSGKMVHFDTATKSIDRTIDFPAGGLYKPVIYDTERARVWVTTNSKAWVFDLRTGEAVGQAELPRFAWTLWTDNAQNP